MVEEDKAPPSPPTPKSPSQMKLVIVGALALFIALVGAQVAVPLINGMIAAGSHAAEPAAEGEDEEAVAEEEAAEEEESEEERTSRWLPHSTRHSIHRSS